MRVKIYLYTGYYILRKDGILEFTKRLIKFFLSPLNDRIFVYKTNSLYRKNKRKYDAVADPYMLISVNPQEKVYVKDDFSKDCLGKILDGDWDDFNEKKTISKHSAYKGLKERFCEGKSWEETDYVSRASRMIDKIGAHWGYTDIDSFIRIRCAYLENLFYKIQTEGYRSNTDNQHEKASPEPRHNYYYSALEPLVMIGRRGQKYLVSGRHRFAIARIQGIKSIPCNVLARHKEWQELRDAICNKPFSELSPEERSYLDHPDMQDLVENTD